MGVSPQSVLRAVTDPLMYDSPNGLSSVINPSSVIDSESDYDRDYLIFSPSAAFRITDTVSLDFGANINLADQVKPMETVQAVIGITVIGRIKAMIDTDGDGIKNNTDIEPDTPRGYVVDDRGRAVDSDNDSVPDGADKEMNTPLGARVNERGIGIDADEDGIYDGIDMEPMTPKGCPVDAFGVALDEDRDGVPDGFDREQLTPRGAVVDADGRAVDGDGDGVPNGLDLEPDTPQGADVDRDGRVLDEDGDGVPDGIDQEPNTPRGLLVDKVGRALIREEFSLLREGVIRLNTVYFTTGRAVLDPESYRVLDDIGRLLLKYASLNVQIEGHTDSSGDAAINMRLARERAQAVLEYILERFSDIDHRRFRVVGFGSEKPIAPNNTAQGRKLNRRVEFVVINQGELMKFNPAK
ncbi:Peptidoglycan-associated lipoprotein [subsurface metagenome]